MRDSFYRLLFMITIILVLAAGGTLFFVAVEGMELTDAIALTVSTLSTVGWADTAGLGTSAKIFCTLLSLGAITVVVGFIATFSQFFLEGSIQEFLGRKKMDERIGKLSKHYIICGFGMTGMQIAKDLKIEDKPFIVLDKNPESINRAREIGYLYLEGDATDEDILKQAGIDRAVGLFSVLDTDADNLLVVLSARGLNEGLRVISRVTSDELQERFKRAGASSVVSYIDWAARNMHSAMLKPNTLALLSMFMDATVNETHIEEYEIPKTSQLVGKMLQESGIREETGIYIMGLFCCAEEMVMSNPSPTTRLKGGDVIVGLGTREGFKKLATYATK